MFLKEHGGTTFALVKKKSLYWFSMRRLLRTSNSKALFIFFTATTMSVSTWIYPWFL